MFQNLPPGARELWYGIIARYPSVKLSIDCTSIMTVLSALPETQRKLPVGVTNTGTVLLAYCSTGTGMGIWDTVIR